MQKRKRFVPPRLAGTSGEVPSNVRMKLQKPSSAAVNDDKLMANNENVDSCNAKPAAGMVVTKGEGM